jgi:phosphotransferase system  glucose/maltose/N-acetylglucosamine-specific IIC component
MHVVAATLPFVVAIGIPVLAVDRRRAAIGVAAVVVIAVVIAAVGDMTDTMAIRIAAADIAAVTVVGTAGQKDQKRQSENCSGHDSLGVTGFELSVTQRA